MMNIRYKIRLIQGTHWAVQNWLILFLVFFGLFNLLPFLAPIAVKMGIQPVADAIYVIYTPLCHQMAQRSFFLFGDQLMYSPNQLPFELTTDLSTNMLTLKYFTGNETIGWKVAWSDRMVYMYGATWISALIYALASRRCNIKRLLIGPFILLMFPMIVDGTTHMLSDMSGGLFVGFRYTNDWLVNLTGNTLPVWFYTGDALGSFNAWMRLISGIGFGIAVVWISFPLIAREMQYNSRILAVKLQRYGSSGG